MTLTTTIFFASFVVPLLILLGIGAWLTLSHPDHRIPAPWEER